MDSAACGALNTETPCRFTNAYESGLLTFWRRNDYLSPLFGTKFNYQQNALVQNITMEDVSIIFMIALFFYLISLIVFLFEVVIIKIKKNN